jgi:hypothetical protein
MADTIAHRDGFDLVVMVEPCARHTPPPHHLNRLESSPAGCGAARRSFGGAATNAELVALGIGEDHPAGTVRLTLVGEEDRTQTQCPFDLGVASAAGGPQVEMNPVFGRLAFGYTHKQKARLARTFDHEDRVVSGRVTGSERPSEKLRPEQRKRIWIYCVEGDLVYLERS